MARLGIVGSSIPNRPNSQRPSSNPFWGQGYVDATGAWHPGRPTATSAPAFTPPAAPTHSIRPGPTGPSTAPVPAPGAPGPGAPGQTAGTSGTQTSGQSGPPLDATAINNIATNQFKATNSINSLNTGIGDLRTNLAAALGQLAYQQPRDQLRLEQGANQRGALYSSAYNQGLGDLTHSYSTRQTGLTTTEGQREGGLAAQIQAILGGIPLYNQGQANLSVARAIAAAAANPATGQPASLTPEQVKYIQAGLAGAKSGAAGSSSPKVSGTIQSGGPWKATKGRIPPRPRLGLVGTSNFGRR